MTIRVVLVDDQALIRAGFRAIIDSAADLEVVGEAEDGERAMEQIAEHRPDLVFLDVMMPQMTGYEVVRAARQDPEIKDTVIVLLTAKGQDSDREVGLAAGANDFMTKPFSPSLIVEKAKEIFGD